jgi:pyridoxine 5-phosphate synthase
MSVRLGINVDHVATLRQARGTNYPNPLFAANLAQQAGADLITVHLREDRRHIQERDVLSIKEHINIPLNLELANNPEIIKFAVELVRPEWCCIVPEKREELTTEGGLDVIANVSLLKESIDRLHSEQINISLFVEANLEQIETARELGVKAIELHTGSYADSSNFNDDEFNKLQTAAKFAKEIGLQVHAGHGLHLHNTKKILQIQEIEELNIGHSIVSDALFVGFEQAVKNMKRILS